MVNIHFLAVRHRAWGCFLLLFGTCAVMSLGVILDCSATNSVAEGLLISPLECSPDLETIRFEFTLTDYHVDKTLQRSDGTLVSVPGLRNTMEVGEPSLPVKGFYVGIPADVSSATVRLLSEDFIFEHDCSVLPWREPGCEASPKGESGDLACVRDGLFPQAPVRISHIGFLRSQKIALIKVCPIQLDARRNLLRIVRSGSVEIRLVRDARILPAAAELGPRDESRFEPMLAHLLANYEQARFYRLASRFGSVSERTGEEYWYDPSITYLKLSTSEDGVYKVDYDVLRSRGVAPSGIDTTRLKLYYRGEMVPILVIDGGDGSFDEGDFVVFMGGHKRSEQIGWALDEYTDEAVWWLCWDDGAGMRYQAASEDVQGSVDVLDADSYFWAKEHFEQDVLYDGWNDDVDQDSWFWDTVWFAPDSATVDFKLRAFGEAVQSAATVSVRLKGNSSVFNVNPDHHSVFYVNGGQTPMGDFFWDGYDFATMTFQVPAGNLKDGRNTITTSSPGDTEASVDSIYINWVAVEYPRRYQAIRDETWFKPPAGSDGRPVEYCLAGFGQSDVLILDITDGRYFPRYSRVNEGGSWVVRFVDTTPSAQTVYWATTQSALRTPLSAVLDEPSTLRDPSNQADLIIITVPEFFAPLAQLVEFRRAQGISVKVVDLQNIFDEFSYGMFNPLAIRSFLWFAYNNWTEPIATHVLLVGDASWDYRFILTDSVIPNYVPSYLDPARDDKFVNVTGNENDWYPDFAIGRMPVQNAQDLTKMIVNTIRYETSPPPGDWTRRALLVTGGENWVEQDTFMGHARDYEAAMPADFEFAEVFKQTEGTDNKDHYAQRILEELNRGALITIFSGHGARNQWDFVLESSDLYGLHCEGKTSIVLVMTCHTGRFANPKTPCIGERFIMEGDALQGALGYWGSTGLTSVWNPYYLTMDLLGEIFDRGSTDIGLAIMAVKLKFYEESEDVSLASSQAFLADPMLRINLPPIPSPSDVEASVSGDEVTISWDYPDTLEDLAGFHVCIGGQQEPAGRPLSPCDDGYAFWTDADKREMTLVAAGASASYCAVVRAINSDETASCFSESACFKFGVSGSGVPKIIAAGYADSSITHQEGGKLSLYAMVEDPDGLDDIERVAVRCSDVPGSLDLDEILPGIYYTQIDVGPGLKQGQYLLELRASDRMGNVSAVSPYFAVRGWGLEWPSYTEASQAANWTFDDSARQGPLVLAAGYLSSGITSFGGGELTLVALVAPGPSGFPVAQVDVYLDGVPIGAQLSDDGLHGDFNAGDGIFGLEVPIPPGEVPGNYLVGLRAVDEGGLSGPMWPFVSVW